MLQRFQCKLDATEYALWQLVISALNLHQNAVIQVKVYGKLLNIGFGNLFLCSCWFWRLQMLVPSKHVNSNKPCHQRADIQINIQGFDLFGLATGVILEQSFTQTTLAQVPRSQNKQKKLSYPHIVDLTKAIGPVGDEHLAGIGYMQFHTQ